jgi:hypothetical protein
MTKKPRPSINDQLARIASQSSFDVTTLPRDSVETLEHNNVEMRSVPRENVATIEPVGPDGYKRRVRYEKPHASLYAHPKVFKALREIAVAQDCKPHDLYLEGLRLVLRAHGRDFDALNRGE